MKGRDGGRSRANCGLDGINEGEPGSQRSQRSAAFPRGVRAAFRRPAGCSAIFPEVQEHNGAVGAHRREGNRARMESQSKELKEWQS